MTVETPNLHAAEPTTAAGDLITEWHEASVTDWLFLRSTAASTLWQWLQLPFPPRILSRVATEPFPRARYGPGDIDVLVSNPHRPDLAVAFECKRITVRPEVFDTEFPPPGKLPDFTAGCAQANGLRRLGFHRVFLLGIVQIDCSKREDLGGLTGPLVRRIEQACPLDRLRKGVGVAFVELMQYDADRSIEMFGGAGVKLVRNAWRFRQPKALTAYLRTVLLASG